MRSTRWFAFLIAVAVTIPVFGADDTDRSARTMAVVPLEITPEGRPAKIEIDPVFDAKLAGFLQRTIESWEFEPATVNGRPATAKTTLTINMSARIADSDGTVRLQIDSATTGPGYASRKPPRYPVKAWRASEAGEVMMSVEIDAKGNVKSARIERSVASGTLEKSALMAVKGWTFIPERVDGMPIATTALVPISFCIAGKPCPRLSPDAEPSDSQPAPIARSVVALKTEVAAR